VGSPKTKFRVVFCAVAQHLAFSKVASLGPRAFTNGHSAVLLDILVIIPEATHGHNWMMGA
jgi:hypothetical protein